MATKPKRTLQQITAERKAKTTTMQKSVSEAGILGMYNRDKNKKFKRGTKGVSSSM